VIDPEDTPTGMEEEETDGPPKPARSLQELLLAGIGWATVGLEAADELADDLARRVGVERSEMRAAVRDSLASWRREAERMGDRRSELGDRAFERLGVVRREEVEDLALRVAQLEHRIRLLEKQPGA
jgi:polyhydroxyalkanoate synthesis regulator phasin